MAPGIPQPQAPTEPAEPDPSDDAAAEAGWSLWMAPAAIGLGFALGLIGTILVESIGAIAGSSLSHPTPAVSIVSDVVFDLGFVAAAVYLAGLHGRPSPAAFGFRWPGLGTTIKAVLLAGLVYYVVTALYANIVGLHGSDKLPSELGVSKHTAALIAAAVFVCVIAPIAEEFFFRGFLFGVLRRWRIVVSGHDLGTWLAAVVTGLLFGLAHSGSASPQYLLPLAFLGFVLCLVRWRTRSLYPCIALHSINNSLALGVNELSWNAAEILALMAGALLVIAALTGPLAGRRLQFG
jgi:membrane protease YdiL (CAAX protease family)